MTTERFMGYESFRFAGVATVPGGGNVVQETDTNGDGLGEGAPAVVSLTRVPVMEAALWIAEHTNRTPCLWGPTSVGKTFCVSELAERRGSHLITVLLSQGTPDEITGFQVVGEDGMLHAQPPYWWREMGQYFDEYPDGEVILFFDEVGQARTETRAVIYTFLRDRTIQGRRPTGRVLVLAATNPGDFSAAWRSRMAFLHFPATQQYLTEIASGHWLAEFVAKHAGRYVAADGSRDPELSNEPPPEPETIDASVIKCIRQAGPAFFRLPKESQEFIFSSLLPRPVAESLWRHVHKSLSIDAEGLLAMPEQLTEMLTKLERPRAVSLALSALSAAAECGDTDRAIAGIVAILDSFTKDADKLLAYYAAAKPKAVVDAIAALPADKMSAAVTSDRRINMIHNRLTGKWIDALVKQSDQLHSAPVVQKKMYPI